MIAVESLRGRRVVGRLERGDELHAGLLRACERFDIRTGFVRAIGACEAAEITQFEPETGGYRPPLRLEGFHELVSLNGNVSLRDGKPFLHLHALLAQITPEGSAAHGGHLISARVFALEFEIVAIDDHVLERNRNPATGLALWQQPG